MLTPEKRVILNGSPKGGVRYSYRGSLRSQATGPLLGGSIDFGPAAADRVVLAALTSQAGPVLTSVIIGGVTLTAALGASNLYFSYGLLPNVTGPQTVAITFASGSFNTRVAHFWTMNGLSSNSPKVVGTPTGTTVATTLTTAPGDLVFGLEQYSSGAANFVGHCTENPAHTYIVVPLAANEAYAADWTIAATNGTFSINDGATSERVGISFR